jgi:hypothetical protein
MVAKRRRWREGWMGKAKEEEQRRWVTTQLRRRSIAGAGDGMVAPPAMERFPLATNL